jgi:hypothetical protein
MRTFETKVQYNTFETGEYTEIAERDYEAVVMLIKRFDWDNQRYLQPIDLTGPSIVINNVLKLGAYYDGKFCLYYLLEDGLLYRSVQVDLAGCLKVIKEYYSELDILDHFTRFKGKFQVKKHFFTNPFIYRVTIKRIISYLLFPIGFITAMCLMMVIMIDTTFSLLAFLDILGFWMFFAGVNVIYFFNYYWHVRNKFIRISKGINDFEYGTPGNSKIYFKSDISLVKYYEPNGNRNPYGNNIVIEIEFKNSEIITFPNLLINSMAFFSKTHYITKNEWQRKPFPKFIRTAKRV